jgi:hypothetical protein
MGIADSMGFMLTLVHSQEEKFVCSTGKFKTLDKGLDTNIHRLGKIKGRGADFW